MKLVLQLVHLYKEIGKTWTDVTRLFSKIFPGEGSKRLAIRRRCVKEASTWHADSESDIQTCLLRIVDNFEKAGEILDSIGVGRNDLMQCSLQVEDVTLTNWMLFELERFRVKAGLPWNYIYRWISCFGLEPVSDPRLKFVSTIFHRLPNCNWLSLPTQNSDTVTRLSNLYTLI